ncbi:hypothetical protein H5410_015379 [Solanum commersonii]|uniref:Reverse transcriptase n=1 Tax=Solanum commersonii TaxID=4109 RepID=A0A9J5ZTX8_SOLCO|nr:hypothetical protein H5410_015379 [Solanum commersonii]
MMNILRGYELVSGQKVNKDKSFFYLHEKTLLIMTIRLRKLTGLKPGNFPFIYLGCPVYYGRKHRRYYKGLIKKIVARIYSWQNRFLTFGGWESKANTR